MGTFTNKYAVIILLLTIIVATFSYKLKKQTISADLNKQRIQLQYIPKLLNDTYLGMPFSVFKRARMVMAEKDSNLMDFRIEYNESIEDNDIRRVTYYFDKDNNQPLYEYIIEYKSVTKLLELIQQKYGHPNDGNEWIFDSGEGFLIKVWSFENKLCIAGVIKDTEWWNQK